MMSPVEDTVQDGTGQKSGKPAWGTGQSDQYDTGRRTGGKVSVYEAAGILGVTVDAIRKRIQRGTIPHQRDEGGRVWVILDAGTGSQDTTGTPQDVPGSTVPRQDEHRTSTLLQAKDETIAELRDQVDYLRGIVETRDRELEARTEELRRRDIIISSITQRIPELPPASSEGVPDVPEKAPGEPEGTKEEGERAAGGQDDQEPPRQQRSWLGRFFFGP